MRKKVKKSRKRRVKKIKKSFFGNFDLENDSKFSIFEVIIIVFISIIFGIIVGYILTYSRTSKITDDSQLSEIISTYNSIKEDYYEDVSSDTLVNAAVEGMVDSLDDPYSSFMDSSTTTSFSESVDGYFGGIGATVMYDEDSELNEIIELNEDGPADKAGLKVGDLIVSVDGKSVKGICGTSLTDKIRGEAGTKVKIKVKRNGVKKVFTITRENIEVDSVESEVFKENNKKIGYLDVDVIASNTYKQFSKKLNKLEKKNIDALIIDLRDNPGGHLSQTKDILSLFFNKKTVLYQIKDKNGKKKVYSISNGKRSYPIVILVNECSASAAEIMTSCFMENYDDVTVVGNVTYGKGTVQQSLKLSTGSSIKYTIQKWLTASGKSIDGEGITPDVVISQDSSYYENATYDNDSQLQKALELLK